jgi:hypothetical protein
MTTVGRYVPPYSLFFKAPKPILSFHHDSFLMLILLCCRLFRGRHYTRLKLRQHNQAAHGARISVKIDCRLNHVDG